MTTRIPATIRIENKNFFLPAFAVSFSPVELYHDESGQDLIEYALVAALIGLGTVTGINGIAARISSAIAMVYTTFGSVVSSAVH